MPPGPTSRATDPAPAASTRRRIRRPTLGQLAIVLLLLGLAWRVLLYALGFPIWGDEAFVAVDFAVRDYREMIQPSLYGQIVPIAFMWAELAISRVLGLSEWALRLLPSLAGVAALLLVWRFARHVLPRQAAFVALGIFASSYYVVRHGAEVKPYIIDLLVSLALTILAWGVCQRPQALQRWLTLVLFAGVAVWCSYPVAFVGGAAGLLLTWLVWRERFRAGVVAGWLAFGVVLCGSFLLMYLTIGRPHAEFAARLTQTWAKTFPPLTKLWAIPVWLYLMHTGLMFAYPHGGTAPGSIITFLCVLLGAVRLARTRPALLLLLLGPLPLALIAAAGHAYPYGGSARTMLYMAPAFCLLAGLGLLTALEYLAPRVVALVARLHARRRRRTEVREVPRRQCIRGALFVTMLVLAAIPVCAMIGDVLWPYQSLATLRSREAVRALAEKAAPGDRWVVFNAREEVPYAPFLGDWRGVGGQFVFDVLRFAPVPLTWSPPPETIQCDPGQRVWLLVYRAAGRKVDFPADQLAAYVATIAEHLGQPRHESHSVKSERGKNEAIEAFCFRR
jgi:hypothetical protein